MNLEKELVEEYIIKKLEEVGWKYVSPKELDRKKGEPLLEKNLIESIKRINRDLNLSEEYIMKVLVELKTKTTSPEDCRTILRYYKVGIPIRIEETKDTKYVRLFDYENIYNNEFIVTNQIVFEDIERIIPDIILFVNGIPIVIIECKNPADTTKTWVNAYRDIISYSKKFPELFKYLQIGIAAEKRVRYFPIVPWLDDVRVEVWRSTKNENFEELDAIVEMLEPKNLLDIIKNFIFIRSEAGRTYTKVIARYIQFRAANKIYNRVVEAIKNKYPKDRRRGLIWHWQGSGKTLTMIFSAHKLYKEELLNKPTIFIIVDRKELEEQIFQEISSIVDLGIMIERVESKESLKEILVKNKQCIIIVLIHKFKLEEKDLEEIKQELEKNKKDSILKRENVIVFVDEAHRSQYGILAAYMRYFLENAFYFAFTGTPRNEADKNTFELFCPKGEEYLDKYFIDDSIRDGFTLRITYELAPEELRLDRNKLYSFLDQELEEMSFEEKEKLSRELNEIKIILENESRINKIAEFIANHFKEKINGKFKAFIVTASRIACVRYKKALDRFLPSEYSEIVMTYNKDDPPEIIEYFQKLKNRFGKSDADEINKEIINMFKNNLDGNPKILIVTDMLLTGFDAPILQTMYLDKPLKGNKLLQTIARVNRPMEDRGKAFGLIVDFIGIFSEIERAFKSLEFYRPEEIFKDIETIKKELEYEIGRMKELLSGIDFTDISLKNIKETIAKIERENKDRDFVDTFNRIRKLYVSLGVEKEVVEYEKIMKFLQILFEFYRRSINESITSEKVENYFLKNALKAIYESTEVKEILSEPTIEIGEKLIEKIREEEKDLSEDSKVFNRIMIIRRVIRDKPNLPKYISIREKIEKVIEKYKKRKENIKTILKELEEIFIEDILKSNERIRKTGLSEFEENAIEIIEEKIKIRDEKITKIIEKKVREFFEYIENQKKEGILSIYNLKNFENQIRKLIRIKFLLELKKELKDYVEIKLSDKEKDEIVDNIYTIVKEYIKT